MGGYPTVCGRPEPQTGRRHGRATRVRAHRIFWEPGTITIASTADAVLAEVAAATGLAEGPAGVRDVILAISRTEPVAVRAVSQLAELPVPIVTAICNELRKRGVVDRSRPVRLTEAGREVFGGGQPGLTARCP